jgi:ferrous iron transport protein A
MTLDDLKTGMEATVLNVGGQGALRRRLLDMGLTPGTSVSISRVAPLGDPIELRLRGYTLSIRREDAGKIEVETGRGRHGHAHRFGRQSEQRKDDSV